MLTWPACCEHKLRKSCAEHQRVHCCNSALPEESTKSSRNALQGGHSRGEQRHTEPHTDAEEAHAHACIMDSCNQSNAIMLLQIQSAWADQLSLCTTLPPCKCTPTSLPYWRLDTQTPARQSHTAVLMDPQDSCILELKKSLPEQPAQNKEPEYRPELEIRVPRVQEVLPVDGANAVGRRAGSNCQSAGAVQCARPQSLISKITVLIICRRRAHDVVNLVCKTGRAMHDSSGKPSNWGLRS